MTTEVKHRRGTTAECNAMIPAEAELIVDTTLDELRLGDGATAGGIPQARRNTNRGFSARTSIATTCGAGAYTKVQFNVEDFDPAGEYDNSTNYRYTPLKAGKYLVTLSVGISNLADTKAIAAAIYKNGSLFKQAYSYTGATQPTTQNISVLVDMNGTTDYLEAYMYNGDTVSRTVITSAQESHFSAFLTTV